MMLLVILTHGKFVPRTFHTQTYAFTYNQLCRNSHTPVEIYAQVYMLPELLE